MLNRLVRLLILTLVISANIFVMFKAFAQDELDDEELTGTVDESAIKTEADDFTEGIDPQDVFGYWNMYDFGVDKRVGIIYFYEYEGKVYGRMMVEFDGKTGEMLDNYMISQSVAPLIPANPVVQGMDIMWDLDWSDKKGRWIHGKILDPRRKTPYTASLWRKSENEIRMRGGIRFLNIGLSITWDRCELADIPEGVKLFDEKTLVPKVYFDEFKVLEGPGYVPGQAGDPRLEED